MILIVKNILLYHFHKLKIFKTTNSIVKEAKNVSSRSTDLSKCLSNSVSKLEN